MDKHRMMNLMLQFYDVLSQYHLQIYVKLTYFSFPVNKSLSVIGVSKN